MVISKDTITLSQIKTFFEKNAYLLSEDDANGGACVYFVKQGEYTKIGTTTNLKKRIGQLQSGSVLENHLLYFIATTTRDSGRTLEINFHKLFAGNRVKNEFFIVPDLAMKMIIQEHKNSLMIIQEHKNSLMQHKAERHNRSPLTLPYMELCKFAVEASLSKEYIMSHLPARNILKTRNTTWIIAPAVALRLLNEEGP